MPDCLHAMHRAVGFSSWGDPLEDPFSCIEPPPPASVWMCATGRCLPCSLGLDVDPKSNHMIASPARAPCGASITLHPAIKAT